MKRTILLSILCGIVLFAKAQRFEYVYKGIQFKCKINNNVACITSFDIKAHDVTIPAIVVYKDKDYPVKQVSTFLNGVNYLTVNLTLEEGIEDVDKYCFNEFRKLRSVYLPQSINHIGKNAFRDSRDMTLTMPSSFDELSIRQGAEIYPKGNGDFASVNIHQKELERKNAAKEEKEKEKVEKEELKNKLKEQERLLAEKERLLAKTEMNKEDENNSITENADNPKSGKLFGLLRGSKKGKDKQGHPQVDEFKNEVVETKPAEPVLPPVDVDIDIPVTAMGKNQNMYCVIIANEKYEDVPEVEYAKRDGEIFREYCIKTLGIPEKQIKMFLDASYTDIKRALTWMETMADVTEGNSKILLYYAGHGMPDEKDKTAYLIPTDGFPKDITTCFRLSELYGRLGKIQTQNVTVILDACFSGVKRGSGQALVAARGIAIKPKEEVLNGNIVVFTATSNDETALAYKEKRHGMFTYFLLNKLKETKGKISFGDLFSTISSEVKKNSMLENDKLQTPSVNVSASMRDKWKDLHF